jgi:SnoaL-like domain
MFDGLVKPFKKAQHVIVNTNFNITGTTATGTANIMFWGTPDPTNAHLYYSMGSRYYWKFRKEGSQSPAGSTWKTVHTKVEKIWESSTLSA